MEQNMTTVEQMIRAGRSVEDILAMVAAEAQDIQSQIEKEKALEQEKLKAKETEETKAKARQNAATALMDYLEAIGAITAEDRKNVPDEVVADEVLKELEAQIAAYANFMKMMSAHILNQSNATAEPMAKKEEIDNLLKRIAQSL